jgi:Transcription factor WhiB
MTTPTDQTACQSDPDRWFRRRDRRYTLEQCLTCTLRRQCAAEALAARPSIGMWAGIWIERNFPQAQPRLQAIARPAATSATSGDGGRRPTPLCAPPLPPDPASGAQAAERVIARAAGHCEVMILGCRYSLDDLASRVPGDNWRERDDPSGAYAVCRNCKPAIARTDPLLTRQLGYTVDSPTQLLGTPFYWRQSRWVLLDFIGRLRHTDRAAA